jgi:hypothetical protein
MDASLWLNWYQQASPCQRQQLLSLAAAQGFVLAHQLPAPETLAAPRPSPLLPALLNGQLGDLVPLRPACPETFDESLDAAQRLAVARAVSTPDVCLIQGYPGTGKSRILAEILRQTATRGQRVLLLAPSSSALDRVLERLAGHDAVCALRGLEPHERPEQLPACVRCTTLAERVRTFHETTLPAARQALADAEALCASRRAAEPVWDVLAGLLGQEAALRARIQELTARVANLPAEVEAEMAAPGANLTPLQTGWLNVAQARDETLAKLDAQTAEARSSADKLQAEEKQIEAELGQVAPLAAAKQEGRWWTGGWWRATFSGRVLERVEQLQKQREELHQRSDALARSLEDLSAERARAVAECEVEYRRLRDAESTRRKAELDGEIRRANEPLARLEQQWQTACRELTTGAEPPRERTPEALEAARAVWSQQRQRAEEQVAAARQWAEAVESALPTLPARLAGCANVVALTTAALSPDPHFGDRASAPQFDLLLLEEAHQITEAEFLAAARRACRWVLVGEPRPENADVPRSTGAGAPASRAPGKPSRASPLRPGFFQRLWSHLHPDPRRLPSGWVMREGRLVCRLRPVSAEQVRWVESERVADRSEIELRIVAPPRQAPYLAEVLFPGTTAVPEAKDYIYRELQELTLQASGSELRWLEKPGHLVLELSGQIDPEAVPLDLEGGVRELVGPRTTPLGPGGVPWHTCGLQFDRAAGWDRERAERWVEDNLGLRDLGRTALLAVAYRSRPALGQFLADLLYEGACQPVAECGQPDGPAVEFVAVPGLPREAEESRHPSERPGRWSRGGTATVAPRSRVARGGAGLEIDLADPRRPGLPAELRACLPAQGLVNFLEARAVVRALEALVVDPAFRTASADWQRTAGCGLAVGGCAAGGQEARHGPVVAVMALFAAQVELLRVLLRQSSVLAEAPVEVGLPAAFHQRECLVAVLSLTRSHTHRAVPYGEHPEELVRALTRAAARLLLFGDPGTLARRSQWQGALDHLDEIAGRREQALTTHLVSYIQGHGPHGMTFRLQESGAP